MGERPIEEISGGELLDHVEALGRAQRECEVKILLAARQHAVLHDADSIDPWQSKVPGGERARRFGGEGTPLVAEFAAADLGGRLGLSSYAGRELIADALDLSMRLPRLWQRVQALEVRASYARLVARKTRELTKEQAARVDERVAESADGRVSWTRFETLVEAAIVAADPAAAAQREEAEARRQFANPTGSDRHGMRGFYIRGSFATIARFDATVAFVAQVLADLGDESPLDQRRVKAVLVLANPARSAGLLSHNAAWRAAKTTDESADQHAEPPVVQWAALLPAVTVYVHLYGGTDGDGDGDRVARVEGHGPVTEAWVRDRLGPEARFTIKPVLDIEGQAPVDAYEIPHRHRQTVHLMTPADIFPYSTNTSRTQQIDHTKAFVHGAAAQGAGQSRIGNYGPMTLGHHRIKTHGKWQVEQPFPGIYLWRDPHGAYYLVDHTGTRRIPTPTQSPHTWSRIRIRLADLKPKRAA
jgi:hypothetical protein